MSVLVHCLTNDITDELVANAILAVGGKPIMADDPREFTDLFSTTDVLLLNLGHLSLERESSMQQASDLAKHVHKQVVVDLVGYGISKTRDILGDYLINNQPTIIKGNTAEMRRLCHLATAGRGIDAADGEQTGAPLDELATAMQAYILAHDEQLVLVATGEIDLVVSATAVYRGVGGVATMSQFVGSGDMIGGIIATFLGQGMSAFEASKKTIDMMNAAGEYADQQAHGAGSFRTHVIDALSNAVA